MNMNNQHVQTESDEKVTASWVVNRGLREMIAQRAKVEDRSESSLIRQILREHFSHYRYQSGPVAYPYMQPAQKV